MSNKKSAKRALLLSLLSMLLCVTMLVGTTFAWFTDSVTSAGNIIQSGTLDAVMKYSSTLDGTYYNVEDEGVDPVFNYTKWEPGYTDVKYIEISNNGSLAFAYQLHIKEIGEDSILTDVIDVYVAEVTDPKAFTAPTTLVELKENFKLAGTLSDLIAENDGALHGALLPINSTTEDVYERVGKVTVCVALHMKEDADNTYQNLGTDTKYDLVLIAKQYTEENDAFDDQYDVGAEWPEIDDGNKVPDYVPPVMTNEVEVTAENIASMDFTQDNTAYKFVGAFDSLNITPATGLKQLYDGSGATVSGELRIGTGIMNNYSDVVYGKQKAGEYTVYGFTAKSIGVAFSNTTLTVAKNTTEFIDIDGGNVNVIITHNTVDGKTSAHNTYQNKSNKYGVYIYAINYDLTFTYNTVKNTLSHSVGIYGRQADPGFDLSGPVNKISEFKGNTILISSAEDGRAALKIWDDTTYAPRSYSTTVNTEVSVVLDYIRANNTLTKTSDKCILFSIYNAPAIKD